MKQMMKRLAILLAIVSVLLTLMVGCSVDDAIAVLEVANAVLSDSAETSPEPSDSQDVADVEAPTVLKTAPPTAPDVTFPPLEIEDGGPYDSEEPSTDWTESSDADVLDPHGTYTSKEDVALYIHLYGELPENFITKKEAEKLGWSGGPVEPYAPGKCIGGSHFGNYEGLLPEKKGRSYTECDIDSLGKARGAKRIVFSNDGLIYYTGDHYESFELLYGEE